MKPASFYMKNPQLDGGSFNLVGEGEAVLLIHGFTATPSEVRPLGEFLNQNGYAISAPLLPGHNTHPKDLNNLSWQDWYAVVEQSYLQLRGSHEIVWVGGESMGALLAMHLAAKHPEVRGLLLFAPALIVNGLGAAHLARFFIPFVNKKPSTDKYAWRGYNVYPTGGMVQLLKLQKTVGDELGNIHQPTLIISGRLDASVAPEVPEVLMNALPNTQNKALVLENSPHVLLLAEEKELAFRAALDFMREVGSNV